MPEVSETNPCKPEEVNICPACGAERVWRKSYKVKDGSYRYGWRCNPCGAKWTKEDRDKNREAYREKDKAYYYNNLEKRRARMRGSYTKNREHNATYRRQLRRKHIEEGREWTKTEKGKASRAERYRRYKERHPDRWLRIVRNWMKSESGKRSHSLSVQRRKALKKAVYGDVSRDQIQSLFATFKDCYYCGSDHKLTMDHVAPLDLYGPHSIENLVVACKSCNCKKRTRTPEKWAEKSGMHIFPMEERFYYLPFPRSE